MTDPMKTVSERLDELLGPGCGSMIDIPEDIINAARHAAFPDDDNQPLVEAIARAILAERERCARAVEQRWMTMAGKVMPDGFWVGPNAGAAMIAAIRGGSHGS